MPAKAPMRSTPSSPMLMTPARSTTVSPRAASNNGVAATSVEWRIASLLVRRAKRKSIRWGDPFLGELFFSAEALSEGVRAIGREKKDDRSLNNSNED